MALNRRMQEPNYAAEVDLENSSIEFLTILVRVLIKQLNSFNKEEKENITSTLSENHYCCEWESLITDRLGKFATNMNHEEKQDYKLHLIRIISIICKNSPVNLDHILLASETDAKSGDMSIFENLQETNERRDQVIVLLKNAGISLLGSVVLHNSTDSNIGDLLSYMTAAIGLWAIGSAEIVDSRISQRLSLKIELLQKKLNRNMSELAAGFF